MVLSAEASGALLLRRVRGNAGHATLRAARGGRSAGDFVLKSGTSVTRQRRIDNIEHCVWSIHVAARPGTSQNASASFIDGICFRRVVIARRAATVVHVNPSFRTAIYVVARRCVSVAT